MFNLKTDLANRNARRILDYALFEGASEIHCELGDPSCIRFRTEGLLKDVFDYTPNDLRGIIDTIASHARIQSDGKGQFVYHSPSGATRFHVYRFSTTNGEHIVLRPLQEEPSAHSLSDLGLHEDHEQLIREQLQEPGFIVVSGPAGSGVTTTLHALAEACDPHTRSIAAITDTTDVLAEGIQHIPINPRRGFDYAHALRALLRHRPDVIMLTDLPNAESTQLAAHAAAGGATILAGMESPESIPQTLLNLIITQRRVPAVCRACHDTYPLGEYERTKIETTLKEHPLTQQLDNAQVYRSRGCDRCRPAFAPSCGIFAVSKGNNADTSRLLIADGLAKALRGLVSIDHVLSLA